ncbi:hypothetical protein ACRALDRAFT_1078440 [Sodiomyces alcalophilus JCM 7366]|uniref:uncharacterized protein n=1 Tax=Sodiomyces alcalophilus JCM 7366 TaxID=591952 RepID=UPI0039B6B50D
MATEAPTNPSVDASTSSDANSSAQSSNADSRSQNASVNRASVNGSPAPDDIENKHITSVEEQANSAEVSVSGGSDTEASRGDSTPKTKDGEKSQPRSSTGLKKPTTFKAVSVNKTFLASKAAASSSTAKANEKGSTPSGIGSTSSGASGLSGSRPRLVAKTGGSSGTGAKFSSAVNGATASTGPDPNAVWNKNRPVPAPDPRKLTDEELQKYGIHMANRLGPESTQGQNNWADIDDDDDDWAPDSITWTDGTKVTLPQPSAAPTPTPPDRQPSPAKDKPLSSDKSRSPVPSADGPTTSQTTKSGYLPSGKGLILKGASVDKPTLVAKPSATTTQSKSPWAKLPPIDRTPPVVAEPPPFQAQPRPPARGHAVPGGPEPHGGPREIAPDDFSRSAWRDGPGAGNKELFNSQSGRYEPAPDRRPSWRSDQHPKQPALLQRPQVDQPEPSPAFQSRTTAQDGHHGRRRGSSSVSTGNSLAHPQRPFFKGHEQNMPPHDLLPPGARRGSLTASIESPASPRGISPSGLHGGPRMHQPGQPWRPHPSPATSHATLHNVVPPAVSQPERTTEDEFELQKKIMREKRELAMQRRREQEAREEAERRERIKAKLEKLGPPPERKSAKESTSQEEKPPQIRQRPSPTDASSASQPKESAVSPPGRSSAQAHEAPATDKSLPETAHEKPPGRPGAAAGHSAPPSQILGRPDAKAADDNGTHTLPTHLRGRQDGRANSSWTSPQSSQPDRIVPWVVPSQQSSTSVWAPNNTRGLGNGTFNENLGRAPTIAPQIDSSHSRKGPAPIGPPSTQRAQEPAAQQQPAATRSRWAAAIADSDRTVRNDLVMRQAEQERQLAERGLTFADTIPDVTDTWRPATKHSVLQPSRPDMPQADRPSTSAGGLGGSVLHASPSASQPRPSRFFPAKDVRNEPNFGLGSRQPRSPSPPPPEAAGHPAFDGDALHPHVSLPRPQPIVRLPPAPAATSISVPKTGSSFSWANPAPFKDGPTTTATASSHRRHGSSAERDNTLATVSETERSQFTTAGAWDERFRNLFSDRKAPTGPRKAQAPARASVVDPSSRSALDETSHRSPAMVCLPQEVDPIRGHASARKEFRDDPTCFTSKPVSEECFEEQEMGSLPLVRVPRDVSEAAWNPAPPPHRHGLRRFGMADISSAAQLWIPHDFAPGGGPEYRIQFPGMITLAVVLGGDPAHHWALGAARDETPTPKPGISPHTAPQGVVEAEEDTEGDRQSGLAGRLVRMGPISGRACGAPEQQIQARSKAEEGLSRLEFCEEASSYISTWLCT